MQINANQVLAQSLPKSVNQAFNLTPGVTVIRWVTAHTRLSSSSWSIPSAFKHSADGTPVAGSQPISS